jgi:hypothetical protein
VARHKGGPGRYPGITIRPGTERDVPTVKTYKFNADDAQQRLLWATVIESLMKQHGYVRITNASITTLYISVLTSSTAHYTSFIHHSVHISTGKLSNKSVGLGASVPSSTVHPSV